jgi:hypothetical protein
MVLWLGYLAKSRLDPDPPPAGWRPKNWKPKPLPEPNQSEPLDF